MAESEEKIKALKLVYRQKDFPKYKEYFRDNLVNLQHLDDFIEATKDFCTFEYLKEDTDKVMYIDYIHYIMATQIIDAKRMSKLFIEQGVSASLKEDFERIDKLSIRQKYGWTLDLLNRNKITI